MEVNRGPGAVLPTFFIKSHLSLFLSELISGISDQVPPL